MSKEKVEEIKNAKEIEEVLLYTNITNLLYPMEGEKYKWCEERKRLIGFNSSDQSEFHCTVFRFFISRMLTATMYYENIITLDSTEHKETIKFFQEQMKVFITSIRKLYLMPDYYYDQCKYIFDRDVTFHELFKMSIVLDELDCRYTMLIYGNNENISNNAKQKQKINDNRIDLRKVIDRRLNSPEMFTSH